MTAYFVSLDIFDPSGPERVEANNVYGGETRLFVLDAPDLASALRTLVNAVAEQGSRVDRVHKAAAAADFEVEDFPFPVDVEAMIKDAVEQGEICVTPDYTFSPYGNNETHLFYGLFEYFDPSREMPYAGEFCHGAKRAEDCGAALMAILDDLAADDCTLKSVEDFSDAGFYDASVPLAEGSLADLIRSKTDAIVWAEGASLYANEHDD